MKNMICNTNNDFPVHKLFYMCFLRGSCISKNKYRDEGSTTYISEKNTVLILCFCEDVSILDLDMITCKCYLYLNPERAQ